MVKVDKGHVLLVLPASHQVDFKILKKVLGAKVVDIDRENIMVKLFKIKPGALSAFHGPLHKIPVYVDKAVMKAQKWWPKPVVLNNHFTSKPKIY